MKASGFRCLSQLKRQILQTTMRELKAETRICAPYTHKYLFLSHLLLNSKPQTHQNPSLKTTHHQLSLLHKTQVGSYSSRRALASRPAFMGSSGGNKSSSGPESPSDTLSPADNEVALEFRFFRVFKDGRVELLQQDDEKIPPSDNPATGVRSKDVIISEEPPISARIFLPKLKQGSKFPLLFYVHGGGFCMRSAFTERYHKFCSSVAAAADFIVVSIEYGLFPSRPLPACYEDSWAGLQWMASHVDGNGGEAWLNDHADFSKVFIAGNSAGGNICHTLAALLGSVGGLASGRVKVEGMVMVHPFFGGVDKDDMWLYMCPGNIGGSEDPRLKPAMEDLARLGCQKVLIFVGGEDYLKACGTNYYERLKESGWKGSVQLIDQPKVGHSFHIKDPSSEKAAELMENFVSFLKN